MLGLGKTHADRPSQGWAQSTVGSLNEAILYDVYRYVWGNEYNIYCYYVYLLLLRSNIFLLHVFCTWLVAINRKKIGRRSGNKKWACE